MNKNKRFKSTAYPESEWFVRNLSRLLEIEDSSYREKYLYGIEIVRGNNVAEEMRCTLEEAISRGELKPNSNIKKLQGVLPRLYEYSGRSLSLLEWSKEVGVPSAALRNRLKRGWTMEKTIKTSARKYVNGGA